MISKNELHQLWEILEKKFCNDIKTVFSSLDEQGWLNHFAPQHEIVVHQLGSGVTGNTGKGKTIKVFNGSLFSSLLRGRIPAIMMAKTIFKRLRKQGYSHSEIELLGIDKKSQHQANAHVRFERYNKSGKVYESAKVLYSLVEIKDTWYIKGLSTYDDVAKAPSEIDLSTMWSPRELNSNKNT